MINSFELTRFARIPKVIRVICFIAASSLCGCTNFVREPRATTPKPLRSASAPLKEELSRGPRGFHQIALTFDADGEADALPALLDALRNAQIHATFFLTGDWVQHYPAYAAMIVNEGHDVGNHTHHHRDLTLLTDSEIADEIESADALLTQRFNRPIRPLFRAPFGSCDRRIHNIVQRLGYRSICWTIDT